MRSSHNHPIPLVDIAGPVAAAPGPASQARSSEARAGQDRGPLWRRARNWDGRVGHMEQLARTPAFLSLREDVIALARVTASDRVLDIGAGTGLLTLAAAPQVRHVTALDISPAMCRHLEEKLAGLRISNADVVVGNATELPLSDGSVDVVLSNYCLHHLRDADKRRALDEIGRVLRPGGRLVLGDMMFRIGLRSTRDRALIARLVGTMVRGGLPGVLRLLKNALRLATGRGEHPAGADWWKWALEQAGFADVVVRVLDHEGGIAQAVKVAHSNRCQVCGDRVELPLGKQYAEAAHVIPLGLPHNGLM